MLFCGSKLLWQDQARQDFVSQQTNDFVDEALAAADTKIDYSAIKLGFVNMAE